MLKKAFIALALVVVVLLIVVAMQPGTFVITRTTTINAPPPTVFALVNDFHKWNDWSPWEKIDPQMKKTYEGPTAGEGAVYSWEGSGGVGSGKMTLVKSTPEQIDIKLEFLKPFAATNPTQFVFKGEGNATRVTWTMSGENSFPAKAFGLFMNMDKVVGGDFEKGLAQMKVLAESSAAK